MEITYHREGDYLIPDITFKQEKQHYTGLYAAAMREYLENYRRWKYEDLIINQELNKYLIEIQKECEEMEDEVLKRLMKEYNINEELKRKDPMQWVGIVNNCRAMAREIVMNEIIYN